MHQSYTTINKIRQVRGVTVPTIMYGTAWKELHTEALTLQAINCGYRAIDTANQRKHYVETAVGAALTAAVAASVATRESLFLQTKFTYLAGQDHRLPYDANADIDTQVHQSLHDIVVAQRLCYALTALFSAREESRETARVHHITRWSRGNWRGIDYLAEGERRSACN
jgi:diketogulonate reductase-like aldo/keto reductase